jgi:hypothetical protein
MSVVVVANPVPIIGNSGNTLEVDSTGEARVATPAISLFDENFLGNIFDVTPTGKWIETITGSGGSRTLSERTLKLSLTTAVGKVNETARITGLSASAGDFSIMTYALTFGINRPVNHRKRWGYFNASGTDGVYFQIVQDTLEWYTVLSGVTTLQDDISSALTDPDIAGGNLGAGNGGNPVFALFQIEHLESGKINIKIGGKQLATTVVGGATLVGDSEKIPFMEVENIGATASVPDDMEIHWLKLADDNGTKFSIAGKTTKGIPKDVLVTDNGELITVASASAAPPSTTPIQVIAKGSVSGTVDTFIPITNGAVLTAQILSGGAQGTNSGSIVELFEDPNGDLSVLNPVEDIYFNGSSNDKPLGVNFAGDGTRRLVLRRRQFGGGLNEVTARFQGYES